MPTFFCCRRCGKILQRGEKEIAEKQGDPVCAECQFHQANGTDTIPKYNEWLRKNKEEKDAKNI